ncbi:MAG: hypothetical protein H0X31_14920 [Nostocaceae cyanobacterium]|nr:hypothetical protein [Nostocaceae cyanobacterium]
MTLKPYGFKSILNFKVKFFTDMLRSLSGQGVAEFFGNQRFMVAIALRLASQPFRPNIVT